MKRKNSGRLQMVLANAAAAILVGGKADDLTSEVEEAPRSIRSRHPYKKLNAPVEFTNGDHSKLERIEAQNA